MVTEAGGRVGNLRPNGEAISPELDGLELVALLEGTDGAGSPQA